MLRLLTLAAFVTSTTAFFFGGNNCGCEPSVPTCPPTPICPPQLRKTKYMFIFRNHINYVSEYILTQVNPVQQIPSQGFIENYQNEPIVQPYSPVHNLPGPSQLQEQPSAIPAPVQNEQVVPNPTYQEVPPAAAAVAGSKNAEVEEVEEAVDEKANTEEAKEESAVDKKLTNTEVVAEERVVDIKSLKLTDDPLCNSEDLRKLMAEVSTCFVLFNLLS
uniref:CPCFC domain-containing protein n=1 Tax=Heterorhabditis bacteriophora TaxID=37862 RepID=A0A1I7XIR2_HETBA